MIVVGLTGKAGSGKTEVANYLVEAHGFTKLSFATPLKKMLRTLDPILFAKLGVSSFRLSVLFDDFGYSEAYIKEEFPEYRRLMQVLGTDCIRAMDEDFWVRAAMKQLTDLDGRYVFDDVRFPNEVNAVQNATWEGHDRLWRVVRPNHDGGAGAHESEQHEGNMGEAYNIENSDDLYALHVQIDNLLIRTVGVPA